MIHTRNLYDSGLCFCGKQQTTEHLLLDSTCPLNKKQREEFLHKIKVLNARLTITNILNTTKCLHGAKNFVLSTLECI